MLDQGTGVPQLIDALLRRVDLRPDDEPLSDVLEDEIDEAFASWVIERQMQGYDPVVAPDFAAELRRDGRYMTLRQLLQLEAAIAQMRHVEAREHVIGVDRKPIERVVASITLNESDEPFVADDRIVILVEAVNDGAASPDLLLPEVKRFVRYLDGGEAGTLYKLLVAPIVEGAAASADLCRRVLEAINEAWRSLPASLTARWHERVELPELSREAPLSLSRQQLLALTLNCGCEVDLERVSLGYGWHPSSVRAALARTVQPAEWQFVQSIWDALVPLWEAIDRLDRDLNGVRGEAVDIEPLRTSAGRLRGGRYPAIRSSIYNLDLRDTDEEGEEFESSLPETIDAALQPLFDPGRARATERPGTAGGPILLQLGALSRHVTESCDDVMLRMPLLDAMRLMTHPETAHITEARGGRFLLSWLHAIARRHTVPRLSGEALATFAANARANATLVGACWRLAAIAAERSGYAAVAREQNTQKMRQAIERFAVSPAVAADFVERRSTTLGIRLTRLSRRRDKVGNWLMAGERCLATPLWALCYAEALEHGEDQHTAIARADDVLAAASGAEALHDDPEFASLAMLVHDATASLLPAEAGSLPIAEAWWLTAVPLLPQLHEGLGPGSEADVALWALDRLAYNMLGPMSQPAPVQLAVHSGPPLRAASIPVRRDGEDATLPPPLASDVAALLFLHMAERVVAPDLVWTLGSKEKISV